MTDRIRVGVAGAGHWARTAHLPSLAAHPAAELVALADPDPGNLDRSRQRYGIEACFDDALEMLATTPMDALVIATPHVYHYPIAAAAIARGIHVLIEKPLVLDPADGRRLIDAAKAAGVEIVVGYTWHYNEQVLTARRWIAEGRIGSIVYVQSFFGSSPVNLYRGEPEADVYAYGAGDRFDGPLKSTYSDPHLAGGGQGQTQLTHSIALAVVPDRARPGAGRRVHGAGGGGHRCRGRPDDPLPGRGARASSGAPGPSSRCPTPIPSSTSSTARPATSISTSWTGRFGCTRRTGSPTNRRCPSPIATRWGPRRGTSSTWPAASA